MENLDNKKIENLKIIANNIRKSIIEMLAEAGSGHTAGALGMTDIFTLLIIALGGFFLARRLFIPRVRMISTVRDYLTLLLVMAPFLSAFIAYHHFFNYRVVIYSHMIIGEIAIIIMPFTGLIHMPFIIFSRFFIDSEYSIIPGNRNW